uniref:Uncharacterized protein n=1 Tax=Lactuca sativa TaxID=4236 RepID=A0A9R1X5Y4_LACSA|nr:hypothetical protein LSAT_V11C600305490 [Lactuca sativa]
MGLAYSLALKLSGVTSNMQAPVGGTISRNENGEPSGLMIDSAMKVVLSCVLEVSVEERRQALDRASRYAFMRGGTTVVDFGRYFPGASLEHPILRYCLIMSYWVKPYLTSWLTYSSSSSRKDRGLSDLLDESILELGE